AEHDLAVQRADDLVDASRDPDLPERLGLERPELAVGAGTGRFWSLAGPRSPNVLVDHTVLIVDRRVLGEVVQVVQVLRVEGADRDRTVRPAVLLILQSGHDVWLAGGNVELLAVTREDSQLHTGLGGDPGEHRYIAPAVRRPFLRDDQHLGRPVR